MRFVSAAPLHRPGQFALNQHIKGYLQLFFYGQPCSAKTGQYEEWFQMFRIALFVFLALGLASPVGARNVAGAQVHARGKGVPAQCVAYGKTYNKCEYYVTWDTVADDKMTHICVNGQWQEAQGEPQYWLHFTSCDRRTQ